MKELRIGVYVCHCGTNIAAMVDVEKLAKELSEVKNVIVARDYKYMCSDPGQDLIIKDIQEHKLNRIVVAACSPRMHEVTFRKALEKAGLNPYYLEMANIREQCSWVHTNRNEATIKAKDLILAAIKRVKWHEPLDKRSVPINEATLIIGGGISGISAALELANAGKKVYLVEKSNKLGGIMNQIDLTFPFLNSARQILDRKLSEVVNHPNIEIFLNTEIGEIFGYIGNFETQINGNKIVFGNIIVATGLKPFDASRIPEYGYGKLPDVITSLEFENMLKSGDIKTKSGKQPQSIAIIHCVGSRNEKYNVYCSRVCCLTALKYINQINSVLPETSIFDIYADMRTFGKYCEEFYSSTSRKNVTFLVFDQKNELPKIREASSSDKCNLIINFREKLSGEIIEVPADMVILMVGMEAHEAAKEVAHKVGVSMCGNNFYIERHPKLDPVATTTDGVYVVGTCQAPKDIPDSISQAKAAAARILATIEAKTVDVEVTTAFINEDLCCGCQTCIKVCPYSAISFDAVKKVSIVNEVLCKGCGTCAAACPTGAAKAKHFTDVQILSQIEGLFSYA
ncbi:MAG: CoB--CoM heterodisulfide reductase iron-sulfur subunit A family protein [Bacteroidales bacterium]|nr:CoB--CoM heterodisulfide reductase iron-sulfur subunit A family protein [Bacteroidales bacterium]